MAECALVLIICIMSQGCNDKIIFSHFNIRSLCSQFGSFSEFIAAEEYDVIGLSETWLNNSIDNDGISIPNYKIIRKDRNGRGGGVAFYISNSLKFQVLDTPPQNSALEQLWIRTKINGKVICFGSLYRPPPINLSACLDDLENAIVEFLPASDLIMFGGDLNVNILETGSPGCSSINRLLNKYNLTQLIQVPTRISTTGAKLIDVLVTSAPDLVTDVQVINMDDISDHCLIFTELGLKRMRTPISCHSYRDYSNFIFVDFLNDIFKINWQNIFNLTDVDDMVLFFHSNVTDVFNVHAPFKTSKFTKTRAPWITDNIRLMMKLRQKALTKYKKLKTEVSLNEYKQLRNFVTNAVRNEKRAYLSHKFQVDPTSFWKTLKCLNITPKVSKPPIICNPTAADHFNSFFINNIPKVNTIPCNNNNNVLNKYTNEVHPNIANYFKFKEISEEEVEKTFFSIKSSSAGSDGIGVKMISLLIPYLTPYITFIINKALLSSKFPSEWKKADVVPIPKTNDPSEFAHYRPISILPTLSKILEKAMFQQLNDFFILNSIIPSTQSGFRTQHGTVTALLHVCDDVFRSLDSGNVTALVLLDYSKAFDTLDHSLLLTKLKYFGLHDSAMDLLNDYLTNRMQRVRLESTFSKYMSINQGVPQGSILGPLLFSIYTCDLGKSLRTCRSHQYADDLQLYCSFPPSEINNAIRNINADLNAIVQVSNSHKLVLNGAKSKLLLFGMPESQIVNFSLTIDGNILQPSSCEKNLGIFLDDQLKFEKHVSNILQRAYYKLKLLYMHKDILSTNIKLRLTDTLVLSLISYGNLLFWPALTQKDKLSLQKLQNACLKFSYNKRKFDHVTPLFRSSRWLKLNERFKINMATLVYKIVHSKLPSYLHVKLVTNNGVHGRAMRHSHSFRIPKHKSTKFQASFSYNAIKIYNALPNYLKSKSTVVSFRKAVKLHYFNES